MERKTYSRKATDGKAPRKPSGRTFERKSRDSKPYERKSREDKPYERKSRDSKPFERKSREEKPFERKPYERKPFERKPYEKRAATGRTARPAAPKAKPAPKPESDEVRLNKFIANSGICSRREADTYISTGLVSVNGKIVTELGTKVNPLKDDIRFNGERLKGEKKVYIIMNKPKDFVTTLSDPHADHTVMELISKSKCPERVVPVGRLDKATTGVLLFTNDGVMTENLTHPSKGVRKIYHAFLDKNLKKDDFDKILSGIELEDGPIAADALSYVDDDKSQVGLEIHSGRNRIVRRIFESLGYKVRKLDRVYFAGLTKKNLRRGEWRFLTEKEINLLKMGAFE